VEEVGPDRLVWGSRVPYGVYHQSSAPRTKIPYRPPVKLNERRKREIAKAMQRALVEGTR
jgi:phage gpG-like protein